MSGNPTRAAAALPSPAHAPARPVAAADVYPGRVFQEYRLQP
jgi:hypothetical protein